MGEYINIDDSNFDKEVVQSDLPVLIDFWAPWCGPCRMIAPTVEEIAADYAGKLKVCKLNTEEAQELAMNMQIVSIPTLAIFKNGKEIKRIVGAMPKPQITKFIDQYAF